jgi:hypothetical protein
VLSIYTETKSANKGSKEFMALVVIGGQGAGQVAVRTSQPRKRTCPLRYVRVCISIMQMQ